MKDGKFQEQVKNMSEDYMQSKVLDLIDEAKKEFHDAIFEPNYWEERIKKCMELFNKWFGE
jgi:hypothetical protein